MRPPPVDLQDHDLAPIDAGAIAMVHSAIGRIPGTSLRDTGSVSWREPKSSPNHPSGAPRVEVDFQGWAPSLHMAQISLSFAPVHDRDDPAMGPWLLRQISPILATQRRRARAGVEHRAPLALTCSPNFYGAIEMRHLHVDEALPYVMSDSGLQDLGGELAGCVQVLLDGDERQDHDGGPIVIGESEHVMETGPRKAIRTVGTQVSISGDPGRAITFDGRWLEIHGRPLPETAIGACVGRRVRDIMRMHDRLDDRVIAGIDQIVIRGASPSPGDAGHSLLRITLEPRWSRWIDVPLLNIPKRRIPQ